MSSDELQFNEPFDDQDWLDIGADLRIKIRKEFNRIKKLKDQALADKDKTILDQSLTIRKQEAEIDELRKQRDKYVCEFGSYKWENWAESKKNGEIIDQCDAEIEAKKAEVT